jgi:CDP-glycerol glycerophosphotransferase (TagB/SpsB family)
MRNRVILSKIKIILDYLRVLLCLPLGYLMSRNNDSYIFCERGTDARDNSFHLFKYFVANYPNKKVYFIIDKNSPDYSKVAQIGNVIHYRSWKHVLYYIASKNKISTHIMGYAPGNPYYFQLLQRYIKIPGKHIFLQHGITTADLVQLYADRIDVDLFVCGARPEYEFINSTFGHTDSVVKYTGFARYDNLHGHNTKNVILVMPTWRMYLSGLSSEQFIKSEYFAYWDQFLRDPELSNLLHEKDLKLLFYPHYEMQKFVSCFKNSDDNIVIADFNNYDVQQLLIDAQLLITDYSSVFFDFAYMKKPCIYYQFDTHKFFAQHYKKGYFDYQNNGFGEVAVDIKSLIAALRENIARKFVPDSVYSKRMKDFFELHDNHNCERIYEAIEALNEKKR